MNLIKCGGCAFLSLWLTGAATAQMLGPTPYLQFSDSPFLFGSFQYFHNETFEDGSLNAPGLSANGGQILAPSGSTDSVDADDGSIDGSGNGGNSWWTGFPGFGSTLVFSFNGVALGGLPTHAGLVWTDQFPPGQENVLFEAFDAGGASIGAVGPTPVGDAGSFGSTAEDRFIGAIHLPGISRIEITMASSTNFEVDHVQYGRVPEPSAWVIATGLAATVVCRRRPGAWWRR
jgi:hypothetical protein